MTQKQKKLNKSARIWSTLVAILMIIGIALIVAKPAEKHLVLHNQRQTLSNVTPKKIKRNQKAKGMFDYSKVQPMSLKQSLKEAGSQDAKPIGALAIPAVNLHLPICKGLSDASMSTGGGTMRPDQKMGQGNYPLAGHYMTSKGILFSPLENTQIGQKVYLTNLKNVYIYQIYSKRVVKPTAVYLVKNTKKRIVTLITCADGGKNRWAIRGRLIAIQKANKQNTKIFRI